MDIEQLKMILDAAAAAGEGAFWVALFWLGISYFKAIVWLVALLIVTWFGFKIVAKVNECSAINAAAKNALKAIGNEAKQQTGREWHFNISSDLDMVVQAIRKCGR